MQVEKEVWVPVWSAIDVDGVNGVGPLFGVMDLKDDGACVSACEMLILSMYLVCRCGLWYTVTPGRCLGEI